MPGTKLKNALNAVDWPKNVADFIVKSEECIRLETVQIRLAIWARQFEKVEAGNPALSFIREMQASSQNFSVLISLSLYKPAASAMRSMLETALYYTYFRTHPVELSTLVRDKNYYIDKKSVIDFHKQHTANFLRNQNGFGFLSKLEEWYSKISSIVHGQIPGHWTTASAITEIQHSDDISAEAIDTFIAGENLVHMLFLCTAGSELWSEFSSDAKRSLVKGMPKDLRLQIGLDKS